MKTSMSNLKKASRKLNEIKLLVDTRDEQQVMEYNEKVILFNEIKEYVNSFVWLKQEKYKQVMANYWNSKLDDTVLSSKYKTKHDVENTILYANKKLRERIGENTIELILDGKVVEARKQFYVCSGKTNPNGSLLKEVVELLPPAAFRFVSEEDRLAVKEFLSIYNLKEMQQRFEALNKDAISRELHIIKGQSTDTIRFMEYVDILL